MPGHLLAGTCQVCCSFALLVEAVLRLNLSDVLHGRIEHFLGRLDVWDCFDMASYPLATPIRFGLVRISDGASDLVRISDGASLLDSFCYLGCALVDSRDPRCICVVLSSKTLRAAVAASRSFLHLKGTSRVSGMPATFDANHKPWGTPTRAGRWRELVEVVIVSTNTKPAFI